MFESLRFKLHSAFLASHVKVSYNEAEAGNNTEALKHLIYAVQAGKRALSFESPKISEHQIDNLTSRIADI